MNKNTLLAVAVNEATKSTHRHRLGAVVFKRKHIISKAHNRSYRYCSRLDPKFTSFRTSLHAEVGSILAAKRDLKNTSLLVVRINPQGLLKLAKPCQKCLTFIQYVGIKKVYYSTEEGTIDGIAL